DGPGVQRAGAADADRDLEQLRLRGHRRPLEGARPARPGVKRTEDGLLGERVDLDHDPVDLVVELVTPSLPVVAGLRDGLDRLEPFRERVRAEAVLTQPGELFPVGREVEPLTTAGPVRPHGKGARRRDRAVLLAERAGCGVARVRGELLAGAD